MEIKKKQKDKEEMHTIDWNNITKRIKGVEVLNHISLHIESGNVYGIIGRNGSGKTMLFRLCAGLIHQTDGDIFLDGEKVKRISEKLTVGMMIENAGLYAEMTLLENLHYLTGLRGRKTEEKLKQVIERVGLDPNDKRCFHKYSMGMKQRAVLAQALIDEPDILLLDEPTNGLDEENVERVRIIIQEEKKRGAIILLASHNAEDIRNLSDNIYYMKQGKLEKREEMKC